jgi:hypothetical protein
MPRLRKNKPIELNDDQLYAIMRGILRHTDGKKSHVPKPDGYELRLCREAYDIITTEFWARAEEQQRIDQELYKIAEEYEHG